MLFLDLYLGLSCFTLSYLCFILRLNDLFLIIFVFFILLYCIFHFCWGWVMLFLCLYRSLSDCLIFCLFLFTFYFHFEVKWFSFMHLLVACQILILSSSFFFLDWLGASEVVFWRHLFYVSLYSELCMGEDAVEFTWNNPAAVWIMFLTGPFMRERWEKIIKKSSVPQTIS